VKDWNPSYYDAHSKMQFTTALQMLNSLCLTGDEQILDVGSGNGRIAYTIAKRVAKGRVLGIDISQSMVKYASLKYRSPSLSFACEDVTHMSYNNQFNIVVSFWTLSWVTNQKRALINIVKALKEDGKLLLMYPMRHSVYDVIDRVTQYPQWQTYFKTFQANRPFLDEQTYLGLLKDLPLEHKVVQKKTLTYPFQDQNEMHAFIRGWLPHLKQLAEPTLQDAFIQDIIKAYMEYHHLQDYKMYFEVLEIHGIKPKLEPHFENQTVLKAKL
jgi:trans-aconitate methyltransferase